MENVEEFARSTLELPKDVKEILEAPLEDLIERDLSPYYKVLDAKSNEIDEAINKLLEYRRELMSKLREEKAKRDQLNEQVKKTSAAIKKLRERLTEIRNLIKEKREEAQTIKTKISEMENQLNELKKEFRGYNRKRVERLASEIQRLEWILQTQTLPDPIEKRLTQRVMQLGKIMKDLKEKEEKWKEFMKIRKEAEREKMNLSAIRKSLAIYIEERNELRKRLDELIKERDEKKAKADEYHNAVLKIKEHIDQINELLNKLRELKRKIRQTLRKIRRIEEEKEEIKKKEELKKLIKLRIEQIKKKIITMNKIDYEDLSFLVDYGLLTDTLLENLLSMDDKERAEAVLEELERIMSGEH